MGIASPAFVAADRRELDGLLRNGAEPLRWPVDFAARTSAGWILVANGAGPQRAGEAAEVILRFEAVSALVSTGYCGALDRKLAVADLVVATEVNRFAAERPVTGSRHVAGPIVSMDRVVQTAAEKARLRELGPIAVEMEAAGVAEVALRRGVPFYCVRVVTDRADETLSIDFNCARDQTGRIRISRVVRAALRHPYDGVPELLLLARRSRRASRALGEFLADCRLN
jgi:adenosylhomocysteine nucleosidase